MKPNTVQDLLARCVRTADGCLEWQGARYHNGYGAGSLAGRQGRVHRLVWEALVGPIPEGLLVMHSCDNPPCCELSHLSVGTQLDNIKDMFAKGRANKARGVRRSDESRQRISAAAKARWDGMTDAERTELGRRMGQSRLGKPRGPYKTKSRTTS